MSGATARDGEGVDRLARLGEDESGTSLRGERHMARATTRPSSRNATAHLSPVPVDPGHESANLSSPEPVWTNPVAAACGTDRGLIAGLVEGGLRPSSTVAGVSHNSNGTGSRRPCRRLGHARQLAVLVSRPARRNRRLGIAVRRGQNGRHRIARSTP